MPARPKLGQHFLSDAAVLARIARAAAAAGDTVVEIGPGRGALTRRLLGSARKVVAVEIDPALATDLPRACGFPPNLEVVEADVLQVEIDSLVGNVISNQCVITGNLPYYITSPILRWTFGSKRSLRSATYLMQEEVAERAVAQPGRRPFGYLSCLCRLHSEPSRLLTVQPGAFSPPPRVRSALVRFEMRSESPPAGLPAFLAACFRSPRKTLRNNLAAIYPPGLLEADPCAGLRAQQLDVEQLAALWARLERARTPPAQRA